MIRKYWFNITFTNPQFYKRDIGDNLIFKVLQSLTIKTSAVKETSDRVPTHIPYMYYLNQLTTYLIT